MYWMTAPPAPLASRLMDEWIWYPTYLAAAVLMLQVPDWLGAFQVLLVYAALVLVRVVFEVAYRVAFGPARLDRLVGLTTFIAQIVLWTGIYLSLRG
jgi:hypothetical protein